MSTTESIPATLAAGPGGTRADQDAVDVGHLKRRLETTVRGEVRFDAGSRAAYANDSSNFRQIPLEVEEAAYIDGDTPFTAFFRVALPLALPGLIATSLLTFSFVWNEFLFAVVLTSNKATTLPIMIAIQQGEQGTNWWNICAISMISIVPMVVFAIFLQRRLVTGLLGGALK